MAARPAQKPRDAEFVLDVPHRFAGGVAHGARQVIRRPSATPNQRETGVADGKIQHRLRCCIRKRSARENDRETWLLGDAFGLGLGLGVFEDFSDGAAHQRLHARFEALLLLTKLFDSFLPQTGHVAPIGVPEFRYLVREARIEARVDAAGIVNTLNCEEEALVRQPCAINDAASS